MAWLVRSLLDSQPVASFQRRCGLFPAVVAVAEKGGAREAKTAGHGSHRRRSPMLSSPHMPADCSTCNGSPCDAAKDSPEEYVINNYFYYYLFRISAAMGQEVFYITFLPFSFWIINPSVARKLVIMWSLVMYIGQVTKDLLKWPRPCSPPVVKLEERSNAEYGMPSTHAMAATAISFTFAITTVNQYKYSFGLGLMGAFFFSTMVCLSRIYTGMHSLLDVIVGSLLSAALTALAYPAWDLIDHLMLTNPLCPVICIVLPLLLCYNYPRLDHYSPTRADTTTVLGAGAGAMIGCWINNVYGTNTSFEVAACNIPSVTGEMLVVALAKFLVGIGMLGIIRHSSKSITLKVLYTWYKISANDLEAKQRAEIEVPYKFITYSSIGLSATVLVPLLHDFLGLNLVLCNS